jgi:hypothetical protein
MALRIQVLPVPWDMHKNVADLNRLMESESAPLDNWITPNTKTGPNDVRFRQVLLYIHYTYHILYHLLLSA